MESKSKKVYIETYGCQMNEADTEIVRGLITENGYDLTELIDEADFVFLNTCSVRQNAEKRIYGRLGEFKFLKRKKPEIIVGLLGCMAERLRSKLMQDEAKGVGQIIDILIGPDEYRKLPDTMERACSGEKGIAVQLSRVETYDDISPLRMNGISAWIPVMRGCDKFCSFCVVPFTRGRERNRPLRSIIREVENLSSRGFKEVTLLGQNVNSYRENESDFADLIRCVADVDTNIRVRFATSHPVDMSDKLIGVIADRKNICRHIHLPMQSGSDRILKLMNRSYGYAHYLNLVSKIRTAIDCVSLSTDIIAGFPTETEEDHRHTIEALDEIRFDGAFTFKYSAREHTRAFELGDDIAEEVKIRRINEIINRQNQISLENNLKHVGKMQEVLVESLSKKSAQEYQGRTDGNKIVIFSKDGLGIGDRVTIKINRANSATLFGSVVKNVQKIPALIV